MKVVFLIGSAGSYAGGMEKQAALLAESLSRLPEAKNQQLALHVISDQGYHSLFKGCAQHHSCEMKMSRRNPVLLWKIHQLLNTIEPDIVHAHGHKAAGIAATLKIFNKRWPLLTSVHGIKKRHRQLKGSDALIAVSKAVQQQLAPLASQVIPNIVEQAPCRALSREQLCNTYHLNHEWPVAIAVGRLEAVKAYDRLIQACQNLALNLLIVGDGSQRTELEKLAPSNVCFTGYLNSAVQLIASSDVLLVSSDRESFGMTIYEAWLQETPVICPQHVGATENMPIPASAILANNDISTLRKALEDFMQSPDDFKHSQQACFAQAKTNNSPTLYAKKHLQIYESLVSKAVRA